MRKRYIGMIIFILLIAVLNYSPAKWVLEFGREYHYTNASGEIVAWEMPSKGHTFDNVQEGFRQFRERHPHSSDTILYRAFKRNPVLIWRWHDYVFHPRYKLPYRSALSASEG